jgi:hypothetical protein
MDTFKSLKGVDKLGEYGMSIETVVRATQNAANRNGGKPYYEWTQDRVMEHFGLDEANLNEFVAFNFPFCDLEPGTEDLTIERMECDAEVNTSSKPNPVPLYSPGPPWVVNGPRISSYPFSGIKDVIILDHRAMRNAL